MPTLIDCFSKTAAYSVLWDEFFQSMSPWQTGHTTRVPIEGLRRPRLLNFLCFQLLEYDARHPIQGIALMYFRESYWIVSYDKSKFKGRDYADLGIKRYGR